MVFLQISSKTESRQHIYELHRANLPVAKQSVNSFEHKILLTWQCIEFLKKNLWVTNIRIIAFFKMPYIIVVNFFTDDYRAHSF